jgi:hypothetical protein
MENKLSRARSLHASGVPSPESAVAMSTGVVHPSARFRAQSSASRHFRMLSEDTIQSNERAAYGGTRSASALGTSTMVAPVTPNGYRPLLLASRSADIITRHRRNPGLELNLAPLKEVSSSSSNAVAERAPSVATVSSYSRAQDIRSPTASSTYSDHSFGSPRPPNVRDIKDQVNGLFDKISSLTVQARTDSMRRHSNQSMRTPSPFTHAGYEQGYSGDHNSSGAVSTPPSVKSKPDNAGSVYSEDERQKLRSTHLQLEDSPHFNDALPTPKAFEFPAPPSSIRSPTVDGHDTSEHIGSQAESGIQEEEEGEEEEKVQEEDSDSSGGGVRTSDDYQGMGQAFGGEEIDGEGEGVESIDASADVEDIRDAEDFGDMDDSHYDDDEDIEDIEDIEVRHLGDEMLAVEGSYNEESYSGESYDDENDVDHYDDGAYDSEDAESLYHDTVQMHVSHEDREDAFDYENFFLHSAMGSFTQERLAGRSRSSTFGSDASIETTRATTALDRPHNSKRTSFATTHSFDTTASYTTADDGSSAADHAYEDDEEEDIEEEEYDESGRLSRPALSTRPATVAQVFHHRPTISVGSTTTTHSFPRIVKPPPARHRSATATATTLSAADAGRAVTNGGGILTPRGSPDPLRQLSDSLMDETNSIADSSGTGVGAPTGKIPDMLAREDQLLVQRLVGSLGKCILSLGESGRASADSRMYRRRLDTARRVLEGFNE